MHSNTRKEEPQQRAVTLYVCICVCELYLKYSFCSVSLNVVSVNDNLNDSVPHFLAYIIPSNADQVQDGVYVPCVIHCVLLCQDGHFQNLRQ